MERFFNREWWWRVDFRGYTLLEVIAVLFVVGILTAIAVVRFGEDNTSLVTQTEVVKTHIRFAQARAMTSNVVWGVRSTGGSYWLFRDGSVNNRVTLPGEASTEVDLADRGVSLENFTLSFDSWGIPYSDAGASTELQGDLELSVSSEKTGDSRVITVTPNTGFVP